MHKESERVITGLLCFKSSGGSQAPWRAAFSPRPHLCSAQNWFPHSHSCLLWTTTDPMKDNIQYLTHLRVIFLLLFRPDLHTSGFHSLWEVLGQWWSMAPTITSNIWNINNYQFLRHREGGKLYIIERTTNGILILFQLWLFGLGHLIPISIASLSLGQKFNTFAFWTSHCL